MKDVNKNELKIGDKVWFVHSKHRDIRKGKVVEFEKNDNPLSDFNFYLVVQYVHLDTYYHYRKKPNQILKR